MRRRKRLKKKLRLGRFDCISLAVAFQMQYASAREHNAIIDRFITRIEALELQFGGGGVDEVWSGVAESTSRYGSVTEWQVEALDRWLREESGVIRHALERARDSVLSRAHARDPDYPASSLQRSSP